MVTECLLDSNRDHFSEGLSKLGQSTFTFVTQLVAQQAEGALPAELHAHRELPLILKHLQAFENSNHDLDPLLCQNPYRRSPAVSEISDISLARRLILASASLFICNFICEYFLNI
jgi:hypothetical protein